MNGAQASKITGLVGSLIVRHALAFAVSITIASAAWTLTYFALLFWAIIMNRGIGGPLAYPAGLLFTSLVSSLASLVLFLPSTVLAEWITRRLRVSTFVQIPLSVGFLAILCVVMVVILTGMGAEVVSKKIPLHSGTLFLSMLLPLGLYWWAVQSVPLMIALFRKIWTFSTPGKPAANAVGRSDTKRRRSAGV